MQWSTAELTRTKFPTKKRIPKRTKNPKRQKIMKFLKKAWFLNPRRESKTLEIMMALTTEGSEFM